MEYEMTHTHIYHRCRGFNFRNFVDGKAFQELPEIFAKDQQFVEGFSRVSHVIGILVIGAMMSNS